MRRVDISSEINSRNRHEMQESLVYSLDFFSSIPASWLHAVLFSVCRQTGKCFVP